MKSKKPTVLPNVGNDPAQTPVDEALEIRESQMPIIGARIGRARKRQGLSVREMAELAGVDKNAILRLERGKGTSVATLRKVSAALQESIRVLTLPEVSDPHGVATHQANDTKWWPETGSGENFLDVPDLVYNDEQTRIGKAHDTGITYFEMIYLSRLPMGRLRPSVLEIYRKTRTVTHRGEEFALCLEGTALITVSGVGYRLEEGESITFWSSEPHSYAPAKEKDGMAEAPVKVLTVRLDDDAEKKRKG